MVGKTAKMTFADTVGRFLNKPFRTGGRDADGYDCLGFMYAFYQSWGRNFPTEFGGITLDTYHDYYTAAGEEADLKLLEFAETLGRPVPVMELLAGDFVVVRHPNGRLFPAVYTGNGTVAASFTDAGVRVVALSRHVSAVTARRL